MTFAYIGPAVIKHVNLRKEGATDAKYVAADIKLVAVTDADILIPFNPLLRTLLFNEAGDPRIGNLDPISLDGSIKHLTCTFPEWKVELGDAEAKKFSFEPMPGHRVGMTFSVAIEPRGDQTAKLAEMLGETVRVEIGVEADLLAEKGDKLSTWDFPMPPDMLPVTPSLTGELRKAAQNMQDMVDQDGVTTMIMDGAGKNIATFTPKKPAKNKTPNA